MGDFHNYATRGVAGVSMLLATAMMIMGGYVFVSRLEDLLSSKFPESNVHLNLSGAHANPSENEDYEKLLHKINDLWVKNRSILVSSSMLTILAGLLQCIFSGLVVLADSKSISLYIRKWVTVHFILIFVLIIILINTIVLSENNVDKNSWDESVDLLKEYLLKYFNYNNYTSLYRFLNVGQHLIYIGVGMDLGTILILMGVILFLMRNNPTDYQSYD